MQRNVIVVADDVEQVLVEVRKEVEKIRTVRCFSTTNAVDLADYIVKNAPYIFGVISDVWILRTPHAAPPNPQNEREQPGILHVLRKMRAAGIDDVPVYLHSRYFSTAADGRTSSYIRDAGEKYSFIVEVRPLYLDIKEMVGEAYARFAEFQRR